MDEVVKPPTTTMTTTTTVVSVRNNGCSRSSQGNSDEEEEDVDANRVDPEVGEGELCNGKDDDQEQEQEEWATPPSSSMANATGVEATEDVKGKKSTAENCQVCTVHSSTYFLLKDRNFILTVLSP